MKILKLILTIVALLIAFVVLIWRFAPPKMVEYLTENIGPAKALLCQYPVQVRGEAMIPLFRDGQRIVLSKCVEDRDNIPTGTVILYERPGNARLSVIRERIAENGNVRYRVSQEARQQEIDDVYPDRILAIYGKIPK